jgi:hypothetical protein
MLRIILDEGIYFEYEFIVLTSGTVYSYSRQTWKQEPAKLPEDVLRRIKCLCEPGTETTVTWDWFVTNVERAAA